ncbi:hypothetical protein B0I35DRAFT_510509 [Stachybotrys elegans]|uniref:Nephrocystin 3-like N-terminal domain-containing protein n=1 Tax=Stachybotrys elegans TaxID=80388 RepID=A0A8K0SS88_9HYPO|nr:hypothetical protein B0I35DRAFT_510509 [Stachybotrys elegans]
MKMHNRAIGVAALLAAVAPYVHAVGCGGLQTCPNLGSINPTDDYECILANNPLYEIMECVSLDASLQEKEICRAHDDGNPYTHEDEFFVDGQMYGHTMNQRGEFCIKPRDVLLLAGSQCRGAGVVGALQACPQSDPRFLSCLCEIGAADAGHHLPDPPRRDNLCQDSQYNRRRGGLRPWVDLPQGNPSKVGLEEVGLEGDPSQECALDPGAFDQGQLKKRQRNRIPPMGPRPRCSSVARGVLKYAQGAGFYVDVAGRPVYPNGVVGPIPLPYFDDYYPEHNLAKRCYVGPVEPILYCVHWPTETPIELDYDPGERNLIQYSASYDEKDATRTEAPLVTEVTEVPDVPTEALTVTFADAAVVSTTTSEDLPAETGERTGESAGIVFLGTPHHGSALARWGLWMSQMARLVRSSQTNPEIIRVLQSNSEELARIQDSFHAALLARRPTGLEPIDITCCYEELPMGRVGLIVPQESAVLPGYIQIGIRADHSHMTKFQTTEDAGFVAVTSELDRWIKQAGRVAEKGNRAADANDLETQGGFDNIPTYASSGWLFQHEIYRRWTQPHSSKDVAAGLLTIKGNPGAGKSVLMKEAIHSLESEAFTLIGCYSFRPSSHSDDSSPVESSNTSFYRCLLGQMLDQAPTKPWDDVRKWAKQIQAGTDMASIFSVFQLQTALRNIILSNKKGKDMSSLRIRIFVDAINYCTEESPLETQTDHDAGMLKVLEFISNLTSTALDCGVDIGVCVSRQYFPDFGAAEPKTSIIEVEKHNQPDVHQFIVAQLGKLGDRMMEQQLSRKLRLQIADGFLWATLVTREILKNRHRGLDFLLGIIDKVPPSLDTMYERTLTTFKGAGSKWTPLLFQVALGALKPMTPDQFRVALAFTAPMEFESFEEWEMSDIGLRPGETFESLIRHDSFGLLEVANVQVPVNLTSRTTTRCLVRFIHSSVVTFLRERNHRGPLHQDLASHTAEHCHLRLFESCVNTIDFFGSNKSNEQTGFLDYAYEFWTQHARRSGVLINTLTELPYFISNCKLRKAGLVIHEHSKRLLLSQARESVLLPYHENDALESDDKIPDISMLSLGPPPSMVVMLATMGCTDLLRVHMSKCRVCKKACSIDEGDPIQYKTAVKNALIGKWTEAASFLLDLNYNGNIDALVNGQTLLYGACYFRDVEVVKYLLSRGSDASISCDTAYEFPLHAAIALGFEDIIKLLLEADSEKTGQLFKMPRYDDNWTALHFAVDSGRSAYERTRILKVLLKLAPRGVGLLDIEDVDGYTPLELASQTGIGSIEEVLLNFQMEEDD